MKFSGNEVGEGGSRQIKPGKYLFDVLVSEEYVAKSSGNNCIKVELTCVGGNVEGQEGKQFGIPQILSGGKVFDFAAACCLTDTVTGKPFTPANLAAMRAAAKAKQAVPDVDFAPVEAVGRRIVAEVVMGKKKDDGSGPYPEIGFWIVNPYSDEAKAVIPAHLLDAGTVGAGSSSNGSAGGETPID